MTRRGATAATYEAGRMHSDPASYLPALYSPQVAGYARGPWLTPKTVTPTQWRWRNCRTYLVLADDGLNYRAVRVTDDRTHEFAGYWAVELLGTMLPAEGFE